jgi:hypothetical protein
LTTISIFYSFYREEDGMLAVPEPWLWLCCAVSPFLSHDHESTTSFPVSCVGADCPIKRRKGNSSCGRRNFISATLGPEIPEEREPKNTTEAAEPYYYFI